MVHEKPPDELSQAEQDANNKNISLSTLILVGNSLTSMNGDNLWLAIMAYKEGQVMPTSDGRSRAMPISGPGVTFSPVTEDNGAEPWETMHNASAADAQVAVSVNPHLGEDGDMYLLQQWVVEIGCSLYCLA